jgi:hypothetical protein
MKGAEWAPLARQYLLPNLAGYEVRGSLVFAAPIGLILKGLSCEPSGFSRTKFNLQAFVQPLYVPKGHLAFGIGGRLGHLGGGGDRWWHYSANRESEVMNDVAEYVMREGVPFLAGFEGPRSVAEYIRSRNINHGLLPHSEDEGYSWLLAGELQAASKTLQRVISSVERGDPEWMQQAMQRTQTVLSMLNRDPDTAVQLLYRWRDSTLQALRLTKFAVRTAPQRDRALS